MGAISITVSRQERTRKLTPSTDFLIDPMAASLSFTATHDRRVHGYKYKCVYNTRGGLVVHPQVQSTPGRLVVGREKSDPGDTRLVLKQCLRIDLPCARQHGLDILTQHTHTHTHTH